MSKTYCVIKSFACWIKSFACCLLHLKETKSSIPLTCTVICVLELLVNTWYIIFFSFLLTHYKFDALRLESWSFLSFFVFLILSMQFVSGLTHSNQSYLSEWSSFSFSLKRWHSMVLSLELFCLHEPVSPELIRKRAII